MFDKLSVNNVDREKVCGLWRDIQQKVRESPVLRAAPVLTGTTVNGYRDGVKNILITGGAGFIASWVVRHLVVHYPNYNIVCFDKLDYCASLLNIAGLAEKPNFQFHYGDITVAQDVMGALVQHNIDTVMHFAAQSHVDLSFGNSYTFTYNNVFGTHVLLESSKTAGVKLFMHVSTDEVYGEVDENVPDLLETAVLSPTNPYAASKAAAEMLVNAYFKSFKLPIILVRSNNVYGPHQYPEKVIPKFTSLLTRGRRLILHGDGSPTRRYLFAGDAADAFDTILKKGEVGKIYNVGSMNEISNIELCTHLLRRFGHPDLPLPNSADPATLQALEPFIEFTQDRPFNDSRYAVDASQLHALGWKQNTTFDNGLDATVGWYKKYGDVWWGDITDVLTAFPEPAELDEKIVLPN
ncbi:hypothetical protein YB2330_003577 [Saitoella coloradoensis]